MKHLDRIFWALSLAMALMMIHALTLAHDQIQRTASQDAPVPAFERPETAATWQAFPPPPAKEE